MRTALYSYFVGESGSEMKHIQKDYKVNMWESANQNVVNKGYRIGSLDPTTMKQAKIIQFDKHVEILEGTFQQPKPFTKNSGAASDAVHRHS